MDRLEKIKAEHLTVLLLVCYLFGFVFWNSFLGGYGFFEVNLLQTRFLSAGFFFILPILAALLFHKKGVKYLLGSRVFLGLVILYFLIYGVFLFKKTSQALGGAKPIVVTILGQPDQISYLEKFNIRSVSDVEPPVQTEPVCELYSNNDIIIIGVSNIETRNGMLGKSQRVITLHQNEISGIQSLDLPTEEKIYDVVCGGFF
jgi:hypothetical protein